MIIINYDYYNYMLPPCYLFFTWTYYRKKKKTDPYVCVNRITKTAKEQLLSFGAALGIEEKHSCLISWDDRRNSWV